MAAPERTRPPLSGLFAATAAFAFDALKTTAGDPKERKEHETVDILAETDYIIFDWDGVLFDSTRRTNAAILMLLQERGDPAKVVGLTVEDVANTFDAPFWDYLRQYGIKVDGANDEETENIRTELADYFNNTIKPKVDVQPGDDELYPETVATILALRESGKKLAIVSAGKEDEIRAVLVKHNLEDCFDSIQGGQHDKAEAIKHLADESDIDPSRITYFGDLPSDIRHTRASGTGVRAVAVARTPASENRLEGHDPDYLVTGLKIDNLKSAKKYTK